MLRGRAEISWESSCLRQAMEDHSRQTIKVKNCIKSQILKETSESELPVNHYDDLLNYNKAK